MVKTEYNSAEAYSESCQTSVMEHFAKIVFTVNYFAKILHYRCLTEVLSRMWGRKKILKALLKY